MKSFFHYFLCHTASVVQKHYLLLFLLSNQNSSTDADVLKLFMIESRLIGFLGGVLGVTLGLGLGTLFNLALYLFRAMPLVRLFVAPLGFLFMIFCLSLLVGLITGLYSSGRANKISALDALRYE